jgi:SIR2-like protein
MAREIDPVLFLAHALHTSPGVYAVLLGSGMSSAAGIPTGWAITLHLASRLARLEGKDPGADPEAWYRGRFGTAPDYSDLLHRLGATQAERQAIIRRYIEPTEDERAAGLKVPTQAHRSVARLTATGSVRVIITTNFDRLTEQALTDEGVDFDVIATVDAAAGARPLAHSPGVVIKLHGDYRDARILNTEAELAAYPEKVAQLLDRVLDEHGLIICGWSATWDPALRKTIVSQPNRRFTTYWATRSPLTQEAAEVAAAREAVVIEGIDANRFFTELAAKTEALSEISRPHPLTTATAVAELKLYLPDPTKRVRLRDLVVGAADRLREAISDEHFPTSPGSVDEAYLRDRAARYEALSETLLALMAVGGAWSEDGRPFADAVERVANPSNNWGGNSLLLQFRRYPALLCMYTAGIAGVDAGRWALLRALLYDPQLVEPDRRLPAAAGLSPWIVFSDPSGGTWLPGMERHYVPVSDHLFAALRPSLREILALDARYEDAFDRFEHLLGLVIQDQGNQREGHLRFRAPVGRLAYRRRQSPDDGPDPVAAIPAEADAAGEAWEPLRAGLFGGDLARFKLAVENYQHVVDHMRQQTSF